MKLLQNIGEMIAVSTSLRKEGRKIGFVPTMGALHAGHESLIRRARQENDFVVVSVFVNPLQFAPTEDFERYPRDLDADLQIAKSAGADLLFTTDAKQMYPQDFSSYVVPEGMGNQFEALTRPGHFRGVLTVVLKLFQIVQPTRAYFGKKDAQQLALIQRMVKDFHLPLEVVPCPIVREADGLAMSSRNRYLSAEERKSALVLSRTLLEISSRFNGGEKRANALLEFGKKQIEQNSALRLDYLTLIDPISWEEIPGEFKQGLVLVAAKVGKTRLIDNIDLGEIPV